MEQLNSFSLPSRSVRCPQVGSKRQCCRHNALPTALGLSWVRAFRERPPPACLSTRRRARRCCSRARQTPSAKAKQGVMLEQQNDSVKRTNVLRRAIPSRTSTGRPLVWASTTGPSVLATDAIPVRHQRARIFGFSPTAKQGLEEIARMT